MKYFIKLAYKGTEFHGWQRQPNADSVQERIENALSVLLKEEKEIVGCGRTDTGVHASEYYAHFTIETHFSNKELAYKLNALLPKTIVVYKVFPVVDTAHARFDALERSYEYRILLENNPFELETTWQIPHRQFDIELMNDAAALLMKHQDFQAFSKTNTDVNNYLCQINHAKWVLEDKHLIFHISANRFLRNMVRAIVGTLLEVGENKISVSDFEHIILSKNRSEAGFSVPAQGLFLSKIRYPENWF